MRFTSFKTFSLPLASLVLSGSLMANPAEPITLHTPSTSADSLSTERQVSDTLRQIQIRAGHLRLHAEMLQSYARGGGLSWQTHADRLSEVRNHINAIGEQLEFLQSVQTSSRPWQQAAIQRMKPSALAIADKTKNAIGLLNENRQAVSMPAYAGHVQVLYEEADRLKQAIDPFVELDKTQKKLESIHSTLNLEEVEW